MSINPQQGFPNIQAPLTREDRHIEQVWLQLLITMWNRTGSAPGILSTELQDEIRINIAIQLQSALTALQAELDYVRQEMTGLRAQIAELESRLLPVAPAIGSDVLLPVATPQETDSLSPLGPTPAEDLLLPLPGGDDWQRGDWTPVITATTPPAGATYTGQSGIWYYRAPFLLLQGTAEISGLGAGGAGEVRITGIDWVPLENFVGYGTLDSDDIALAAGTTWLALRGEATAGALVLSLLASGTATPAVATTWADLVVGSRITFSLLVIAP